MPKNPFYLTYNKILFEYGLCDSLEQSGYLMSSFTFIVGTLQGNYRMVVA